MEKKNLVTKRVVLNALDKYFAEHEFDVDVDGITVTTDEVLEYVASSIAALDKKAESAAKRAAEKKEQGDELRAMVADVLTDEYQSVMDIWSALNGKVDGLTPAMVTARLTQLCKNGDAEKTDVKGDNGRTHKGYKLA